MLEPFDKSRCTFPVPDFASEDEEREWVWSLTPQQRIELLELVRLARWGEEVLKKGMDRSVMQVMTMEEFNKMKEAEDAAEEEWRRTHGWPPRFQTRGPSTQ